MANNSDNILVWPPYIRGDSDNNPYKNRKLTINILQSPSISGGIKTVAAKALAHVKTVANAADKNSNSTLGDTIKNLNAAYDREVAGNTIFTIVLPLPNELTDTQSHDWNTAKGITGTALGGIENQSISSALGGSIGQKIAGAAEVVPLVGAGIAAGAGMEVQQVLGAMSDSMGLRKPLADPGYFQNYTGSQPRTFNMTFDLVPNNPKEAKEIIQIVMKLKEHSSPSLMAGGVSMLAPNYFDIDVSNPLISAMASIKGVVLTNLVINYGADGAMQQFPDGTPKYMQLGLTFVERKIMHAGQFKKQIYK